MWLGIDVLDFFVVTFSVRRFLTRDVLFDKFFSWCENCERGGFGGLVVRWRRTKLT